MCFNRRIEKLIKSSHNGIVMQLWKENFYSYVTYTNMYGS
jgi:hypothetical protein